MKRPIEGKFIVLEGADFCGKTTQLRLLLEYLLNHPKDRDRLISVLATREPSNTEHTLKIREMLSKMPDAKKLSELFLLDRVQHLKTQIEPALSQGVIVVCDRYMYSLVYQVVKGVDFDELIERHKGLRVPDLVLVLSAPASVRLERARGKGKDVFDKDVILQEKLDEAYEQIQKKLSHPFKKIDASQSISATQEDIRRAVDDILGL
ncbi:dTMP kinase [Candidatus Woesearchaeota archaeon]|nr:MAG: dTMP kinase [Candidatus Woesearchaeota archaeon]